MSSARTVVRFARLSEALCARARRCFACEQHSCPWLLASPSCSSSVGSCSSLSLPSSSSSSSTSTVTSSCLHGCGLVRGDGAEVCAWSDSRPTRSSSTSTARTRRGESPYPAKKTPRTGQGAGARAQVEKVAGEDSRAVSRAAAGTTGGEEFPRVASRAEQGQIAVASSSRAGNSVDEDLAALAGWHNNVHVVGSYTIHLLSRRMLPYCFPDFFVSFSPQIESSIVLKIKLKHPPTHPAP